MEVTYSAQAIILDRQSYREDDSRVVIYTLGQGKLELVARGTKKIKSKLAGHLEPISLSDIMIVKGKQFDYIGNAVNQNCFFNIKSDLEKLICASKIINFFNNKIKAEQSDKSVFLLLVQVLKTLNDVRMNIDYELFSIFFEIKLISLLGLKPELYNCIKCKNKIQTDSNRFSSRSGGLICKRCQKNKNVDELTISKNSIKVLRFVIEHDFFHIAKLDTNNNLDKEIKTIISSFLQYYE